MYLALYRKYRPRTFDDVISQEHITTTLKNQIINGSAGHAYLFTGSRGTGKTTCAKIFSMAVNCEHPINGSPCMKCDRCLEILEGATPDVVEMDAASNRGVEDVRRLREEVVYTPVTCKYRVYIIDEVHMLTTEAFNALLKTLEEPPPHVKFILATTELHKVPATISSRCQRFEFRRVDINDSADRLIDVAQKEGLTLDRDAAELISRLSDGGMRDALSVLDRCASSDEHITVQVVRDCAGIPDNRSLFEFSEMIAARNTAACIRLLAELHKGAKDIALLINNLIEHYRDLMIYKTAPNESDLLFVLPDERGRLAQISEFYTMNEVLDCITLLSECAENISRTKQRKTLAEMCLVKMCARGSCAPVVQFMQTSNVQNIPSSVTETTASTTNISQESKANSQIAVAPVNEDKAVLDMPLSETAKLGAEPPPWDEDAPAEASVNSNEFQSMSAPFDNGTVYEPVPPPEPLYEPTSPQMYDVPPYYEQSVSESPVPNEPFQAEGLAGDDYPIKTQTDASEENLSAELKPFSPITSEQWSARIAQIADTDFMLCGMLRDSTIRCADNTVIITSSNSMLLNNVVGDELARVQQKLNHIFGMSFHIRIERGIGGFEEEQNSSPVEEFLKKARKLGITVTVKD